MGVGLREDPPKEFKDSLLELEELVHASGGEVVGVTSQILPKYHPATLMGSGKVQEVAEMVAATKATVVVVDHGLSGVQTRNLEKELACRVLDRSQLILDIFALRAQSYEGKLQVQLAQMLDQLPRMVDAWMGSLSRLGGGIGTRGPGETALEMDRRRIRARIKHIRKQLAEVRKKRHQLRAQRKKNQIPSFALIGYTNSGKSSLLNRLTQSQVLEKDMVFATLDPVTRKVFVEEGTRAVLTDTVGFMRKLPTHLIEAFKATLEETADADILIHVIDLSSEQMEQQIQVVEELIEEFGWGDKTIIYAFNKVDVAPFSKKFHVQQHPRAFVSARTGEGIERLKVLMLEALEELYHEVELFFPKNEEYRIYQLGRTSQILRKEPASQGTLCVARMTVHQMAQWRPFIVSKETISLTP